MKCAEVQNPGNMSESSAYSIVVRKSQEARLYHYKLLLNGIICNETIIVQLGED